MSVCVLCVWGGGGGGGGCVCVCVCVCGCVRACVRACARVRAGGGGGVFFFLPDCARITINALRCSKQLLTRRFHSAAVHKFPTKNKQQSRDVGVGNFSLTHQTVPHC